MANDMTFLIIIITIFIAVGTILPFVEQAKTSGVGQNYNSEGVVDNVGQDLKEIDDFNGVDILLSIIKMFFWTFGQLPFWIDTIVFLPMRILLGVIIYRQFRSGGG